jgi:hypothetical protein
LALGTCTQALAARVVDPASARQAISIPAITAQDAELAALAAERRPTLLAARLEVIAHDGALVDVAQEWLLDRGLHQLAQLAPTREARASVTRLTLRAPIVFTRVDPEHGDRVTPLYDAGATARFVLRQWDRRAARDAAARELATGSARAVERHAARATTDPSDPALAGIADAFRAASPAQLAAQRASLVTALRQGRRIDALVLILAERSADRELFDLLFDYADAPTALAAIAAARRVLDASSAFASLVRASQRADIASAAVLEVARLAAQDPAVRRFLFDALADPGIAPAAAAALARLADPAVTAELGRRLAAARTEEQRRVLALALKLDASPAARAELERFSTAGAGSPDLQLKVRRWLER